jgi:hypothetical protein
VSAEARDDVGKAPRKAVELAARHLSEECTRKRTVVALELGDEPLPFWGEGHQRRAPVCRVRLARHESAPDERVYETSHRPRRHLQRVGKDPLGYRSALTKLPEQVGARRCEIQRLDRLRHVVVQQHDELEDTIERAFVLKYLIYSEVW